MSRHAKLVAATFCLYWASRKPCLLRPQDDQSRVASVWLPSSGLRRFPCSCCPSFCPCRDWQIASPCRPFAYQCLEASERACTWRLQQRQRPTARARSFFINVLLGSVTVLSNRREATKFRSAIVGILSLGIECEDCLTYVVEAVQPRSPMAAGRQRNNRQGACSGKRAGRCLRPDAQRKGPLSKSRGRA